MDPKFSLKTEEQILRRRKLLLSIPSTVFFFEIDTKKLQQKKKRRKTESSLLIPKLTIFQLEVYLKNLAVVIQGAFAMKSMVPKRSVVVHIQEVNHHTNLIASKIAKRKKKKKKGTKVNILCNTLGSIFVGFFFHKFRCKYLIDVINCQQQR